VTYRFTPPAAGRKSPQPVERTLHLGFEDESARQAVWADLLAD
jgi:hypothetical protein